MKFLFRLYALPETNTEVSVSSAVEVVTNGVHVIVTTWHPCPICGATHNPQVVKEYIDTYPTSYGWRAAGAGVVVPASVWAGPMAKGVGQRISFRVVGSNGCSRCVCSAATNSVVDVHELSIRREDYLGLVRTDEGRESRVVRSASAVVDPAADGTSYSWLDCGICSFTGRTDTAEASYFAPSNDTASAAFLAEPLTVSATVSDGSGHSDSATCTTNFTVVKVDVSIGGAGEDKEESEGAFIPYVADAADGRWTEDGTNALVAVSITCEPRDLMEQNPSSSGKLVRHDSHGRRVECGRVAWATGVEITRGADQWHVFNVVKVAEDDSNGAPYSGQFATSLEVRDGKEADDIGKWGCRRWDIESSFHVEKNGGYGLEHNFCNKARASRNIYLLMQIAHNLWQLFNSGCLLPMQQKEKYRNMTQVKWAELIRYTIMRVGIVLSLDEIPRRYMSREFLKL